MLQEKGSQLRPKLPQTFRLKCRKEKSENFDGKNTVRNANKPAAMKKESYAYRSPLTSYGLLMHIKKTSKCKTTTYFKNWLNLVTEYIGESDSSFRMEAFLDSNFTQSTNRIKTTTI